MSELTSASTLEEVQDAYDDNASFEEDGDVAKAKAFITACRILLRRMPVQFAHGTQSRVNAIEQIQSELSRALTYIRQVDATTSAARVKHADFRGFRD